MLETHANGLHATAVAMTDVEKQEKERHRIPIRAWYEIGGNPIRRTNEQI